MLEIGLKTRIVLIFSVMLAIAMLLQSIVVIILGVRTSIREDVVWAKRLIQTVSVPDPFKNTTEDERLSIGTSYESVQEELSGAFSCVVVEVAGDVVSKSSHCKFWNELMRRSRQAKLNNEPVVGYAGEKWKFYSFGSEVALIVVPLVDSRGLVYGSISTERSLLPIYARYQRHMGIALCYLLVNLIIFGSLGFFRFIRVFFKPLDKLVSMAENYHPDEQPLLLVSDDESAFRKLSLSLNALLDRIQRDNSKLRKYVSELEDINKELSEKKELVERSEKLASVGRLSAGMAHEIGNPLSIIQGYVELLGREDISSAEKTSFLLKVQQELDRIKKLIRQLLDFSRERPPAEDKVSINQLIDEVVRFLSLQKNTAYRLIQSEPLAEHDEIVADRDALQQVFINVLFNSIDATADFAGKKREIVVTTCNENSSTLGPVIVVCVKDNGDGIDQENLQKVFDPFFTTKEVGRGTGLGLFVCHTIIERLGGKISIENRMPAGVEVKMEFPLYKTRHCVPTDPKTAHQE